jgi:16S rRNA (uracil1498-N3)-methyltransferase
MSGSTSRFSDRKSWENSFVPQFFINSASRRNGKYLINGEDYHHLVHVRRVRENDTLVLRDEKGRKITTVIRHISGSEIEAEAVSVDKHQKRGVELTLCASILKGKKFDLVIQKAVELGVYRIVPIVSERSIPRLDEKSESRTGRWRRIADEAAKQSLTPVKTVVDHITDFTSLLEKEAEEPSVIADPGGKTGLRNYLHQLRDSGHVKTLRLLVGPEGGFSSDETEAAERAGWIRVNFRSNQLRAETASLALSSIILYEFGEEIEDHT